MNGAGLALLLLLQPLPDGPADDPVVEAAAPLAEGRPYAAARALARLLSEDGDPTPRRVLVAAQAHAQARAWPAVRRLLTGRVWLDETERGEGRWLLGRALLGLDSLEAAAGHYARWLEERGADAPALARVEYARALARLERREEEAAQLEMAAAAAPAVRHWLLLSALQTRAAAADTTGAARLAAALAREAAIPADSVGRELVLAALRAGDAARGLAAAEGLSRPARALLAGEWTAPARLALGDTAGAREELLEALELPAPGAEAGRLLLALDTTAATRRLVAESDLAAGRSGRASELFAALAADPSAGEREELVLKLAEARFAAGAHADVGARLEPWLRGREPAAPAVLGEMWFLAGRSLYRRGRREEAVAAWERAARLPGRDAAYASYLVADVAHDAGRIEEAARGYAATVERFPLSAYAGTSLFRLALLDLVAGRAGRAAARFAEYRRRFPGGNWDRASRYWEGRALEAAGMPERARPLYAVLAAADPTDFYGVRAAERAGLDPWTGLPPGPPPGPVPRGWRERVERASLLRELGWRHRGVAELRAGRGALPPTAPERLLLAETLNAGGWTWQGTAEARAARSLAGGEWTERLLRAAYPLPWRSAIEAAAAERGIEPALIAALAYRESLFDPQVVSSAGAVGLLQLLPRTAAELAGRAGVAEFRVEQLRVPEINVILGTLYLRDLLERFGTVVGGLAAYNAGPHRMTRWRDFPEHAFDPEAFAERIPFSETRRYVKAVQGAYLVYRRLWWPGGEGDEPIPPLPRVDAPGGAG